MQPRPRESPKTMQACETLRDYLLHYGPATAQDLLKILALSRAATYEVIRKAARAGLIRPVAHVHSDGNHDPQAWDIDSPNPELLWRRKERLRGRFCTCLPKGRKAEGAVA
jgi:hypothetical protein